MRDRDLLFHKKWLGLAQPSEGLVFSVPVLADAQIAPDDRPELTAAFEAQLDGDAPRLRGAEAFFRDFLGYDRPGMLVPRAELPADLAFYAAEGGQELRPSFALARGPFASDDPFAEFDEKPAPAAATDPTLSAKPWFALVWDIDDTDLDEPETVTGPWRYPPTAKLERLLRHVGVPVGLLFNGRHLRLVYAPPGESLGHLTFRVEHMVGAEGRPLLTALDLLLGARRAHSAAPEHTLEGLLAESRRRQADVTDELAEQVFEAVELLLAGFEAAAARDASGDGVDWLRPALEAAGAERDHLHQGVLSVVLRLVFLLYAEDQALLPVEHPLYAAHLSLSALYARLAHDAGAHPESMHHRFGAYGQLLALFRAVYFGVKHGTLELPPRRGRLFDPNAYPFLEGGLPGWTAAVVNPEARAAARPPSLDDGTVHRVLERLVVFRGQRLSYRTLDVEQLGSVYESLMGYYVVRLQSPAVRLGKHGVWVEAAALRAMSPADRARFLKETCGLGPGPVQALDKAAKAADSDAALADALAEHAARGDDPSKNRGEPGRLVLQPGEERRRTGSHYTPRSLTEKVVKRTLEPLLACLGEGRTAEQLLQLKICDPAMGSGAFLVATCRELASELVAAWTRDGQLARILERHGDAHLHARRLVAQTCLYGVDKNAAAVELAKLSLWLVTLSRTLPFTFVDHALRHGDSLVGLDFAQLEAFHWSPPGQVELCRALLRDALDEAVELRQQLVALAEHDDPASQGEKRRLFEFSQQAIARVRLVADVCVGAFFAETKDAAREKERARRLALVERWLTGDETARGELERLAAEVREKVAPFHWWIEFPEVFFEERPDPLQGGAKNGAALFEGVVGNPPFMGGTGLAQTMGAAYQDWVFRLDGEAHGKCDLSAHFFRRAASVLGKHGAMGLIATNTIAQGDTRESGLRPLVARGYQVFAADVSLPWPGAAAVTVSIVHLASGRPLEVGVHDLILNGERVDTINSYLQDGLERNQPRPLASNAEVSFLGCKIGGQGFLLTPDEARRLGSQTAHRTAIKLYVGGEDVNTSAQQTSDRFVIDFGQTSLEDVERQMPQLARIVRERVKPYRDGVNRESWKKRWWQFAEVYPAMRAAIAPLERCLVTACVTKHLCFSFQPTDRIFSHKLYVFPLDNFSAFSVLQSRVHVPWAWLLSSTLGGSTLNYSASDCFETFPFPKPDPRAVLPALETIGERLYKARAAYMVETDRGLTKTYNALKDPACDEPRIVELRRLHEQMDRAVLEAYGWGDLTVPPYGVKDAAFEDEVIDRLYVLNAERAKGEERAGGGGKRKGKRGKGGAGGGQGELFE